MLLIYAIYRRDPVFIVGQGAGLFVYLRNLFLIRQKRAPARRSRRLSPAESIGGSFMDSSIQWGDAPGAARS